MKKKKKKGETSRVEQSNKKDLKMNQIPEAVLPRFTSLSDSKFRKELGQGNDVRKRGQLIQWVSVQLDPMFSSITLKNNLLCYLKKK